MEVEPLWQENRRQEPSSMYGEQILYTESSGRSRDVFVLGLESQRPPEPVLQRESDERYARFSPDGRMIVYEDNASGEYRVYAREFRDSDRRWRVSPGLGTDPRWSRDGDKIYYLNGRTMMAVEVVSTLPDFDVGAAEPLFDVEDSIEPSRFDVAEDGRFLMVERLDEAAEPGMQINVVLNWFEELKQRVPTGGR